MPAFPALSRWPAARLPVYALAYAGGVIGYLPLLTVLLPIEVEALAGQSRLGLLTAIVIVGALVASGSNLLFGWLSDWSASRGAGRRLWIAIGLAGLVLAYLAIPRAATSSALIGGMVLFQVAVNAVLAPLMAIMAEETADSQKGTLSGLLAFANPLASGLCAVLMGAVAAPATRLLLVPVAVAICIAPLLLARGGRGPDHDPIGREPKRRRDLVVAWASRLMVQVGGNVLFSFLLYYFESIAPELPVEQAATRIGRLLAFSYVLPLPFALIAGRFSDRSNLRKPILLGAAAFAGLGLAGMAVARNWTGGAICFGAYTIGAGVFLALHAGFSMQLLPSPAHRGRDLGLVNLANTLPALIAPLLTWWLASSRDFAPLLLVLAALTLGGGLLVLAAGSRSQRGQ